MDESTPQERFNQLLAFLKDPQAHPHPTITLNDFVWREVVRKPHPDDDRLAWPAGTPLGDYTDLYERELSTHRVQVYRREAIEIMESEMIHEGYLRGNRRTPDIPIEDLESLVLQLAAVFHHVKHHRLRSPFDNKGGRLGEVLEEDFREMILAFHVWSGAMTHYRLMRPDKMAGIEKRLDSIQQKVREKTRGKLSFDPIDEFIFIFLIHIKTFPNLIANHI